MGILHSLLIPGLAAIAALPGCGGEDPLAPAPTDATLTGLVAPVVGGFPVQGAVVSLGDATVTTGRGGRFEFTGLEPGPVTLRATAAGFEDFEVELTLSLGKTTRDISLVRFADFEFGDFALHAPASVPVVQTVIVALGGPDTRAFASGGVFGPPIPALEAALQELGAAFRSMSATHGLAVLGTSLASMANGPDSDALLLDAVREAAAASGRPELVDAPILVYGISGGAPQASGFVARNPDRMVGLFLKVPAGVESLTAGPALGVPTFMILAELDAFVDNAALDAAFRANRRLGALWAVGLEAGVPHLSLSPAQRALTANWMIDTILTRIFGGMGGREILPVAESDGWLGDPATRTVMRWSAFSGDRRSANWFVSEATAEEWRTFIGG